MTDQAQPSPVLVSPKDEKRDPEGSKATMHDLRLCRLRLLAEVAEMAETSESMGVSPAQAREKEDVRDKIANWKQDGGGWEVTEMASLIESLVAELDSLDTLADAYATANGGYCGNARGVLMALAVSPRIAEKEPSKQSPATVRCLDCGYPVPMGESCPRCGLGE